MAVTEEAPLAGAGEAAAGQGRRLCCAACGAHVTDEDAAIACEGTHVHSFMNPAGVVFVIGCFAQAPGCAALGLPALEWTWFPGCRWQVAVCRACGEHLGWRYNGAAAFHGLILDRLRPCDDSPQGGSGDE